MIHYHQDRGDAYSCATSSYTEATRRWVPTYPLPATRRATAAAAPYAANRI